MTQFNSPALYRPEVPHSVALARLALAALAIALTAASWLSLGAQAGRHDPTEDMRHVELPAVVVSGHRAFADGSGLALVAARGGIECANPAPSRMSGTGNGVTLKQ